MQLLVQSAEIDSRSLLLVWFRCKSAVHELNGLAIPGTNVGKDFGYLWIVRIRISIKEAV